MLSLLSGKCEHQPAKTNWEAATAKDETPARRHPTKMLPTFPRAKVYFKLVEFTFTVKTPPEYVPATFKKPCLLFLGVIWWKCKHVSLMSFVGKSMGRSSDGPIGETIHWKLLNSHLCIFYPASNLCFLLLTQLCAAVKWKIADVSLLDILFLHFPFPSNFLLFCAFSHLMFHLASIKCQYFIYILDDRLLSGSPPGQCLR